MPELIAHLWGDYILQNHWMAINKTKSSSIATLHGFLYSIPFIFLTQDLLGLAIIFVSHAIIDRTRFAHKICQIANWEFSTLNGFPTEAPTWLTTWVVIIVDNTLHLTINHFALRL